MKQENRFQFSQILVRKFFLLSFAIFILPGIIHAAKIDSSQVDSVLARADKQFSRGINDSAKSEYKKVLKFDK